MAPITTQIVRSDTAFRNLESGWNDLVARDSSATLFQLWEWNYWVWKHAGAVQGDLIIVTASLTDDDRLVGIFPLCRNTIRVGPVRINCLAFLGNRFLDHQNIIMDDRYREDVLPVMMRWLEKCPGGWDLVDLKPVRTEVLDVDLWRHAFSNRRNLVRTQRYTSSPFLVLREGLTVVDHLADRSFIKYMQRKLRKIRKEFDFNIEMVDSAEMFETYYPLFVRLNVMRSYDKLQKGLFRGKDIEEMFRKICRNMLNQGRLRLYFALLDGSPAACLMNFVYRRKMYFYQSGLDINYRKFSAGLIMHYYAIEKALAEGLSEYDFLNGNEPYKYQWTESDRSVDRIILIRSRWKAALLHSFESARRKMYECTILKKVYFFMASKSGSMPEGNS